MKPITVKDQVRLSWGRCIGLALSGMSYRMFRSLITMSILSLAVAFLDHVLSYSVMEQNTRQSAFAQLQEFRLVGEWVTRLSGPESVPQVLATLADNNTQRLAEYQHWSNQDAASIQQAQQIARRLRDLYAFFDNLPLASRGVILGDLDPMQAVRQLQDPAALQAFSQRLSQVNVTLPLAAEEFTRLASQDQPLLWTMIEKINHGQQQAIAQIRAQTNQVGPVELLASRPAQLDEVLRQAGFQVDADLLNRLQVQASRLADLQRLKPLIEIPTVRAAMARRLRINPKEVDLPGTINWIRGQSRAQDLAADLKPYTADHPLDGPRLVFLADSQRRQEKLQAIVGDEPPTAMRGLLDLPTRTRWLVIVSFLVCAIGVINAMMMSVTERFNEIATMKCLGALDGFLLQVFFVEAIVQGLVGGLIGLALGFGLALLRGWISLGNMIFTCLPISDILIGGGVALGAGLILGAVAAIGPAWTAARLAPMEAMRVE
ncbi:MAG: ABC transporter permease [Phycisphaeraceae bacterium]|nr:ABC transporter permease [Phycisphaeraceae bacterium]